MGETGTRARARKGRTGFVPEALNWDLAGPREVHPQDLAAQLVEVHVVDGVLRVGCRREGYEAIALVLLLWSRSDARRFALHCVTDLSADSGRWWREVSAPQ